MSDAIEQVLRLVSEGRLTADEAGPILDALEARAAVVEDDDRPADAAGNEPARFARIEIVEGDRKAVDLRVPLSLGRMAIGAIPGLSSEQSALIQQAVSRGVRGQILNIRDDDGDSVRIAIE
jgi:hypothetical protein